MRLSRATVIVLASACTGCVSGGGGTAPVPVTVSAQSGAGLNGGMSGVVMLVGSVGQKATVAASRDAVWAILPAAYESLGLPLNFKEDVGFRLGNDQIKARRALNGVQLRTIVDCGSDLNGEKAETYDIKLTIETRVAAVGNATELTTLVTGLGRSPLSGGNDVSCSTKGELERRILRYLRAQLHLAEK